MVAQKLGGAAKTAPVEPAKAGTVKKEEKSAPVTVDLNNLSKSYADLEAAAKQRTATGVKADDMLSTVEELFKETGKDKLLFSGVATIVKAKFGKKLYNQLRSAILAKTSPYDLVTEADGHAYVVKGKRATTEVKE
jgi:hypothetical protein